MKKIFGIYGSIGALLVGLWLLFIYTPYHNKIQGIEADMATAQSKLDEFAKVRAELPSLLAASRRLGNKRSSVDCQLYAKNDILNLFDHLRKTASKQHLTITEIKPSLEELLALNTIMPSAENPLFITIELHFDGSFIDFGKYMSYLEKAPFFRGVTSCQIKKVENVTAPLEMTIGFRALLGGFRENS